MDCIGVLYALSNSNTLTYPVIFDKSKTPHNFKNVNIGNIFKINGKIYILTCFHCIKNTMEQFIIINGIHHKCKIKFVSDELELACLEIIDPPNDLKFFILADFDVNFGKIDNQVIIQTYNIDDYCQNEKLNELVLNGNIVDILDTNMDKLKSINMPYIPRYSIKLSRKFDDIHELSGLSGSLVFTKNNIIGMISAVENSLLNVIPAYVILRFLNEIKLRNSFDGLCTIVGKFTQCDFTKENSTKQIYGYIIDDTYDINYNNYKYGESIQSGMNLKKNDIILEINNIKFNNNWTIYDNKIDRNLDFRSYIALNYMCGEKIPFKIMRPKTHNIDDYTEKKIIINARPLQSMKYIPVSFSNKMLTIDGFTFIELSEDIINTYMNMSIYIGKSFTDHYIINPYRNDAESIMVLLDIDKNNINKEILTIANDLGLPLVNLHEKNYGMAMITRINKKKPINLDEFKKLLMGTNNIAMQLTVNNFIKIKLIITDNKITTLKLDV